MTKQIITLFLDIGGVSNEGHELTAYRVQQFKLGCAGWYTYTKGKSVH